MTKGGLGSETPRAAQGSRLLGLTEHTGVDMGIEAVVSPLGAASEGPALNKSTDFQKSSWTMP